MIGHLYGVIMYIEDRTRAAIDALKEVGLADEPGIFAKRVYSCVVRMLREFFSQTHTPFSAEFALALFDRLARGKPLTAEFMSRQQKQLEVIAAQQKTEFSEEKEEDAWLSDRYGMTPRQAGIIVAPMREEKKAESRSEAKRRAVQGDPSLPESQKRWLEGYGFAPDKPARTIFMDDYGSPMAARLDILKPIAEASAFDSQDDIKDEGAEASETEKEKKDMCLPDTDLVRAVRGTVEELCDDLKLFTGIDVSNAMKRAGRTVRHREVAPIVREMYSDGEMDTFGYTRQLITVSLPGGRQAQAWLYLHQTSDPTDYDTRAQVALPPQPGTAKKVAAPLPQPASGHVAPRQPAPPPIPAAHATATFGSTASAPRGSRMLNTASQQRTQKLDGRLEIPRSWIRRLGWVEGDDIRAVKTGDTIILKPVGDVGALEEQVYKFTVDRWNRIRLTNRALNKVDRNLGHGGQHVVTLQTNSIRVE